MKPQKALATAVPPGRRSPLPKKAEPRLDPAKARRPRTGEPDLRRQRHLGNAALQQLQSPPLADTFDDALVDDVVGYLREEPLARDLFLSEKEKQSVRRRIVRLQDVDDAELAARLATLSRPAREKLAAAATSRLAAQLAAELADLETYLVDELASAVAPRLRELAELAREAEAEAAEKGEKRPQFPLVFKYLLRDIVFKQVTAPITPDREKKTYYRLRQPYASLLPLEDDDFLFPEIYEEELVEKLRIRLRLPGELRQRLLESVTAETASRLLPSLDDDTGARTGADAAASGDVGEGADEREKVDTATLEREYALLGERLKANIEGAMPGIPGGLVGYSSVRSGLLGAFGSAAYADETLRTANRYYDSLVEANFLQGRGRARAKRVTLIHPQLKAALDRAERMMADNGWTEAVERGLYTYWGTSIRENRNNPASLSPHSFGRGMDINADDNPNLASFGASSWRFVERILGEPVFKQGGTLAKKGGAYTRHVGTIRKVSADSEPEITAPGTREIFSAVQVFRAQSDRFKAYFDDPERLRARLREIVRAQKVEMSDEEIDRVLDTLQQLSSASKGKPKLRDEARGAIFTGLFRATTAAPRESEESAALDVQLLALVTGLEGKRRAKDDLARRRAERPGAPEQGPLELTLVRPELRAAGALARIRSQGDRLRELYDPRSLRAHLTEITRAKGLKISGKVIGQAFESIRPVFSTSRRETPRRRGKARGTDLGRPSPAVHWESEEKTVLVTDLVGLLAPKVKSRAAYAAAAEVIEEQIVSPAKAAAARENRLGVLYNKRLVARLEAVPVENRQALAGQVLSYLDRRIAKADAAREAKELASFLELALGIPRRMYDKKGEKIKADATLPAVAAHGFSNLPAELVTALVSPAGGNLKWLGVHNQDMHHFELKEYPPLPKAAAPSKPEPPPE